MQGIIEVYCRANVLPVIAHNTLCLDYYNSGSTGYRSVISVLFQNCIYNIHRSSHSDTYTDFVGMEMVERKWRF